MIIEWHISNGCFKTVQHQLETKEKFKCEQNFAFHSEASHIDEKLVFGI